MSLVSTLRRGAIATIRLERPGARNAMNTALLGELLDAVSAVAGDATARCLVLTGAGIGFSAGADIREPLDSAADLRRMELFGRIFEAVANSPVPTVAAIRGPCIGGGAELAAACDIRVADATAAFRFPGAAMGYPVGAAKLVGLVGLGAAKDLVLTSRTVTAEEAARMGFVQHLVGDGQAMATARKLADQIAEGHQDTIVYLKRLFDRFSGMSERIAVENDVLQTLVQSGRDYGALAPRHRGAGGWSTEGQIGG
jgi:enoyl-CoA hydratase/carnithine racemase